jgi:hypothetical protein
MKRSQVKQKASNSNGQLTTAAQASLILQLNSLKLKEMNAVETLLCLQKNEARVNSQLL